MAGLSQLLPAQRLALTCESAAEKYRNTAMKVIILTFCDDIDLIYGTLLVFNTLRVGFPTAEVLVFDNGSSPDALPLIEAAALNAGCEFISMPRTPFVDFYKWALLEQVEFNSIVLLDPDVIFWKNVEQTPAIGLFSGRLIPPMVSQNVTAVARIHPSFIKIPDVGALRQALQNTRSSVVDQLFASMNGKEYFWDTLAMLHHVVPGTPFTDDQLDCYDHLFFGCHFPSIKSTLPKNSAIERGHIAAVAGDFEAIRGIWRGQEKDFAVNSVSASVIALEAELLKMPQADIVTEHTFLPGIYERKITIPAWTILTGAEHKTPYRIRLEKGKILVNTDNGNKLLIAPCEFDVEAGMQRAGRVLEEEVVWVDIYNNSDNCTDLTVLEDRLYVVPSCGLADSRTDEQKAKIDFGAFLYQIGMTQNELDKIVHIESDLIDMPKGIDVELRDSPIHGKGLFATRNFEIGEIVCPGRLDGKRTPGGRFINHSLKCNIKPKKEGDDIYAVAVQKINVGDELLVDYRASIRVNFGLELQGELL